MSYAILKKSYIYYEEVIEHLHPYHHTRVDSSQDHLICYAVLVLSPVLLENGRDAARFLVLQLIATLWLILVDLLQTIYRVPFLNHPTKKNTMYYLLI